MTRLCAQMLPAITMLIAGCAHDDGGAPVTPRPVSGMCHDEGLDRFIGQKADGATGAAIIAASGATTLRWGAPGMAMTMDFRPDRVTVSYDEHMVISSARCG